MDEDSPAAAMAEHWPPGNARPTTVTTPHNKPSFTRYWFKLCILKHKTAASVAQSHNRINPVRQLWNKTLGSAMIIALGDLRTGRSH